MKNIIDINSIRRKKIIDRKNKLKQKLENQRKMDFLLDFHMESFKNKIDLILLKLEEEE
jgi:hypothetical protein